LPASPPPPYATGLFYLEIEGTATIPLLSFAGCYDKILGLEYEDCYFTIGLLENSALQWINEAAAGLQPRRALAVFQVDQTGQIVSRTDITNAFLSDVRISDFDAGDTAPGSISLVVVPASIQVQTSNPTGPAGTGVGTTFRRQNFRLSVDGVSYSAAAAIRGIHLSVPKLLQQGSGRRQFDPGLPQFDDILVEVAQTGSTVQNADQWVNSVAGGNATPRLGQVEILNSSLSQVIGTVLLEDLVPIAFPPYPTGLSRRTLMLDLGRFQLP